MAIIEEVSDRGIRGWVAHDEAAGNVVTVRVNGLEVTHTNATQPVAFNGEMRNFGFTRHLGGLWAYLDNADEVSFEHNGERIPIVGCGFVYRKAGDRERDYSELESRIAQGWVFDKKGRLSQPLGKSRKVKLFEDAYESIRTSVRDELGLELFAIYGTLLGLIREGGFIAHDNDIDLSYISKFESPEEVKAEYLQLCELLIGQGYRGVIKPHGFGIKRPIYLDIFPSWVRDGKWSIAYGYHGEVAELSPSSLQLEERDLGTVKVKVPLGAEAMLSQLYGEGWRVPDPGFSHYTKSRKRERAYLASEQELRPIFWKQYYKHNELAEGSTFSLFVHERVASDALVVDIGCGSGRDTTYFATQGHTAIGADASEEGVKQGRSRATPDSRFEVVDVNDAASLDALLGAREVVAARDAGREIVVYLRFFLHAIPAEAEQTLLEAIVRNLPDVTLAAEFRTERDAEIPKFNQAHYRRFVDSTALSKALEERYGFSIDYFHEGTGLSVYKGEDPFLCRIVASRRSSGGDD